MTSTEGGLSYQRLAAAFHASEDGYWDYCPTTGEVFLSDRFYTMLGYQPGAFPTVPESGLGLLHPDDAPAVRANFQNLATGDAKTLQFEFRLKTETGGWRWILSRASPFKLWE